MLDEALLQAIRRGVADDAEDHRLADQAVTIAGVEEGVVAEHFQYLIDIGELSGKVIRFRSGRRLLLVRRITNDGRVSLACGGDLGRYAPAEISGRYYDLDDDRREQLKTSLAVLSVRLGEDHRPSRSELRTACRRSRSRYVLGGNGRSNDWKEHAPPSS